MAWQPGGWLARPHELRCTAYRDEPSPPPSQSPVDWYSRMRQVAIAECLLGGAIQRPCLTMGEDREDRIRPVTMG